MDEVWEPYVTFIAPLSTTVVAGWEGVRKAWEMRFGQFDRVMISLAESHVHINGKVAWTVGTEKVGLLRKDGSNLGFDGAAGSARTTEDDDRLCHHGGPAADHVEPRHRRRGDAAHRRADDRRHGVVDLADPDRHSGDLRRGQSFSDPIAAL